MAEGPMQTVSIGQISFAQLKRFGRRKSVIDASVSMQKDGGHLGDRFAKLLKLQHGTVLRGWRMDVDLRGTGTVDMHEFTRACERLGLGLKAKTIWACFRPVAFDAPPLQLHDLAKGEAAQVE